MQNAWKFPQEQTQINHNRQYHNKRLLGLHCTSLPVNAGVIAIQLLLARDAGALELLADLAVIEALHQPVGLGSFLHFHGIHALNSAGLQDAVPKDASSLRVRTVRNDAGVVLRLLHLRRGHGPDVPARAADRRRQGPGRPELAEIGRMPARAWLSAATGHDDLWTRLHIPVGPAARHRHAGGAGAGASGGPHIPEHRGRSLAAVSRLGGEGFGEALRQLERLPHLGPQQAVPGAGGRLGEGVVDEAAEPDAVRVPAPWRARRPEQRAAERGEGPEVERRRRAARRRRRVAVRAAALGRPEPDQQPWHGEEPRPPYTRARARPGAVVRRHPPEQHSRLRPWRAREPSRISASSSAPPKTTGTERRGESKNPPRDAKSARPSTIQRSTGNSTRKNKAAQADKRRAGRTATGR
jgi:hypothetical protein